MAKCTTNKKKPGPKKGGNGQHTREMKDTFLAALKVKSGNITAACEAANIGRQTYYKWYREDPDFVKDCGDVRESLIDLAESQLLENIKERDNTAIIFFLKCQARHRGYNEKATGARADSEELKIIDKLAKGKIDLVDAGLEYAKIGKPLPEVLKIQLQKLKPPDTIDDADVISDEELDAQFEKAKAEVESQKGKWLEDRRADVALLKQQLSEADGGAADGDKEDKGGA